MIIKKLREIGITSDVMQVLGFLSIFASIAVWFRAKQDDAGHGERFGIFVGLWAPTFFVLGSSLATVEESASTAIVVGDATSAI